MISSLCLPLEPHLVLLSPQSIRLKKKSGLAIQASFLLKHVKLSFGSLYLLFPLSRMFFYLHFIWVPPSCHSYLTLNVPSAESNLPWFTHPNRYLRILYHITLFNTLHKSFDVCILIFDSSSLSLWVVIWTESSSWLTCNGTCNINKK